jgi:hypothetical protein
MINSFYDSLISNLKEMQEKSVKLCKDYLAAKISEYGEINDDLCYLNETLKEFRQNSKEMSNSVNELAYFYTSFQVIKKTLESLSFDYIPYDKKEIMLIECDTDLVERMEKELIKFRFNLQIKSHNKNKSRSSSVREVKKRGVSPDNLNSKHKAGNQSGS